MAIELCFSNRIEHLARRLSDHLAAELSEKEDKFDPAIVIVPNQNMIKWLQLTLSKLQGVLLQVRFDFIENGLLYLLFELSPQRFSARLMDNKVRTLRLVQCLNSLDLGVAALMPLAGYLLNADGSRKIDFAPRVWQLSQRLSLLFQEYEYHRSELIHAWQNDKPAETSMEACQKFLYRTVYGKKSDGGVFTGANYVSLLEYAEKVLNRDGATENHLARKIHIFGMSQISGIHLQLLERLADFHDIYVYTLNPSQEFWEDIHSPGEQRWMAKKGIVSRIEWEDKAVEGSDSGLGGHPLLAAWGKPGRENVRQLCALTGYAFHECYQPPEDTGRLLHRIQSDLLTLRNTDHRTIWQDTSLQIFAAPSRFREVETVYNTICYNLERDETLKLTDVAVLVTDMELYKPIFDAVFNRTPQILSYNLVDSDAQSESLFGQAIIQILQLAQGRFSRKAVFELLLNPCVMQRWDIGVEEVQDWVNWADELNIFHGFSQVGDVEEGGGATPRFSWKQALQRLRLGRIMVPEQYGPAYKTDFCDVVPFTNLAASNLDVLEKFCVVVETLHSNIQKLSKFCGPCWQWAELFAVVCDRLLEIPDSHHGEAAVRYTLFEGLEGLKSSKSDHAEATQYHDWGIELFQEYLLFVLKGISGGRGDYLTGGVTISALLPMRPIPFKILFILGLEEGRFPGREVTSALDLRQNDHRREDVTLAERNCYLFMEMLLCARQKLYLGHVARDIQKDRGMQPCSVINQLKHYLDTTLLTEGFKIAQIPLKGNDPRYIDPNRITAWSDVMNNFSLADRLAVFRAQNHWADFIENASREDMARIEPLTPVLNTSVKPFRAGDTRRLPVTTRQLARFLIDPVQQSAQAHLGLYGPEASIENLAMKEDEPFFSIFPLDYTIEMECLRLWINLNFASDAVQLPFERDPAAILEWIYADFEKQSAAPQGVYGRLDCQTILEKIKTTIATLDELLEQVRGSARQYRAVYFGNAEDPQADLFRTESSISSAALELTSACVGPHGGQQQLLAEIHAVLNWLWQDQDRQWHMLILTGSKRASSKFSRYLLEPLLAYLVCIIKNPSDLNLEGLSMYFHLVYESKVQEFKCRMTSTEALAVLKNLLESYGNQKEFHWLPFETVLDCKNSFRCFLQTAIDDTGRLEFADEMAAHFEELDDYLTQRLAMPIGPELFDIAKKRFGWIFDMVEKI